MVSSPPHSLNLLRILLTHSYCTDLQFAAPLSVGAFIKWGLARLVNDQGGRGFLSWEAYKDFKNAEKGMSRSMSYPNVRVKLIAYSTLRTARGFQPKSCTMYLIARLPASNGRLLYVRSLPTSLASSSMLMEGRIVQRNSTFSVLEYRSSFRQEWCATSTTRQSLLSLHLRPRRRSKLRSNLRRMAESDRRYRTYHLELCTFSCFPLSYCNLLTSSAIGRSEINKLTDLYRPSWRSS